MKISLVLFYFSFSPLGLEQRPDSCLIDAIAAINTG